MLLRTIAAQIPASYRQEILDLNIVGLAVASTTDKNMNYLAVVWKSYIDPNLNTGCNICMQELYRNWNNLLPSIVALQKENNLLDTVKE
jgi:hypothetical protein